MYVAFGLTIGLALYRMYNPDIFADPRALVAVASLSASILGGLLFYLKIDRLVPWFFKRRALRNHKDLMYSFTVLVRMYYNVFHISMRENWKTVPEECKWTMSRVLKSADFYNELWWLKGVFYFIPGVWFLLYSLSIDFVLHIILMSVLLIVLLGSAFDRSRNLASWVSYVVLLRLLRETYSLTRTRLTLGEKYLTHIPEGKEPILPEHNDVMDNVLRELEQLVLGGDWLGLSQRFEGLESSFRMSVIRRESFKRYLSDYRLETAVRMINSYKFGEQYYQQGLAMEYFSIQLGIIDFRHFFKEIESIPDMRMIYLVKEIDQLETNQWKKELQDLLARGFTFHNEERLLQLDVSSIMLLLLWHGEGIPYAGKNVMRYVAIGKDGVKVLRKLDLDKIEGLWPFITSDILNKMSDLGIAIPQRFTTEFLVGSPYQFGIRIPEVISIYDTMIRYGNNFFKSWANAMKQITDQDVYYNLSFFKYILKRKRIPENFIALMEHLYRTGTVDIKSGVISYLSKIIIDTDNKFPRLKEDLPQDMKELVIAQLQSIES